MDNIKAIEKAIEFAKEQIIHYQKELELQQEKLELQQEKLESLDWSMGKDKLYLNHSPYCFKINCNYDSWEKAKSDQYSDKPFFIQISDPFSEACAVLSVENATKLRDYLSQKIDFINS